MIFNELDVKSLKEKLQSNTPPFVIDVREEYEFEDGSITDANIPMSEILEKAQSLSIHLEIVLCCETGKRSKVTAFHLDKRLEKCRVYSLRGGLQAFKNS